MLGTSNPIQTIVAEAHSLHVPLQQPRLVSLPGSSNTRCPAPGVRHGTRRTWLASNQGRGQDHDHWRTTKPNAGVPSNLQHSRVHLGRGRPGGPSDPRGTRLVRMPRGPRPSGMHTARLCRPGRSRLSVQRPGHSAQGRLRRRRRLRPGHQGPLRQLPGHHGRVHAGPGVRHWRLERHRGRHSSRDGWLRRLRFSLGRSYAI